MANNNYPNDDDNLPDDDNTQVRDSIQDNDADDLALHGVRDIIPDNEEYYTLDLKRDFDGDDDEDDIAVDVANVDPHNLDDFDEPPKSSSVYDDGTLVRSSPPYRPRSSNQGGTVREGRIADEDTTTKDTVGAPGHWGVDEDTG